MIQVVAKTRYVQCYCLYSNTEKKSINSKNTRLASEIYSKVLIQPAITCLMLTIKTMKQGMKYVQS